MDREYIAFISYRHATLDSAVAKTIHSLIEQYRIPRGLRRNGKKKFGYVFRDQEELPVSSDLSEDICRALDRAECLIVICSPETKKSPWVSREIDYFLQHHDRSRVFAVLAAGEPGEVLPRQLTQVVSLDGTVTEVEPLALDARADSMAARKKKLRREVLRLYAALLGCAYDQLVLRSQRRKRRQFAAGAAVVLAAALSFSGVLLVKNRQIEEKNSQIQAQYQALLLRESELLTRDALEALAQGNYANAVRSAVAALPKSGEERTYYAPAEAALIQALGLFREDQRNYMVTEIELPAEAPVVETCIHSDGKRLAVADQYNVVTCFDPGSGAQLWSVQLDADPVDDVQLLSCTENMLLGIRVGGVTALSWQDGSVLWQYENTFLNDLPGVLSQDGAYLAVLDWRMTQDFTKYEFYLQVLATADGRETYRVKLAEGMSVQATDELPYVSFSGVLGDFSDDGSTFAGTYTWEDGSGQTYITYYRADLEAGTAQPIYTRDMIEDCYEEEPVWVDFGKRECTVVFRQKISKVAVTIETVDCHSGTCLWQLQPPKESEWLEHDDPVTCLRRDKLLYILRGDMLYVLQMRTGTPLYARSMGQTVLSAQLVGDQLLALLLADGTYTVAWHNDSGVYHSAEVFDTALNLGYGVQSLLCGESLLQLTQDGGRYTGAVITPGGMLAALPKEGASSVVVRRVLLLKDLTESQDTALLPEGATLLSGNGVVLPDGVALGVVGTEQLGGILLTGNPQGMFTGVNDHDMEHLAILPDGTGYITYNGWEENLTLRDQAGNPTVLKEQYGDVLYTADGTGYGANHWLFHVRYAQNGDVLAAACDENLLCLWRNGEPLRQVALPADVQFSLTSNTRYYRQLAICGRKVLLSHFDDAMDLSMDAVVIYDMDSDKWQKVTCANLQLTEVTLVSGSTGQIFALLDDDNMLHIYDSQGKLLHSFPSPVPHGAINQLDMILEDQYFLIKTYDQQVLIVKLATGEILFKQRMASYALSGVHAFADPVNNRLYLCDSKAADDEGLCLDMGSWTVLARIPGLLCYDPGQDAIYCYSRQAQRILRCRLPGRDELVSYCQALFAEA